MTDTADIGTKAENAACGVILTSLGEYMRRNGISLAYAVVKAANGADISIDRVDDIVLRGACPTPRELGEIVAALGFSVEVRLVRRQELDAGEQGAAP